MDVAPRRRSARPRSGAAVLAAALTLVLCAPTAAGAAGSTTRRVNLSDDDRQVTPANPGFYPAHPTLSENGRYVAFVEQAVLVPGDTNGRPDAYVRDRRTGSTERVSVSSTGLQTTARTMDAAISSDGRYVVFSLISRLGDPPTPAGGIGPSGVYVRDRVAGTTRRVSEDGLNAAISHDGRAVAFATPAPLVAGDTNDDWDVYVADWQAGGMERVSVATSGAQSQAGGDSHPALDADGSVVAFESGAPGLVPGDTNGVHDVFVRDRARGTTTRVSVATGGAQAGDNSLAPSVSANGRFVTFSSAAADLGSGGTTGNAHVWLRDRGLGTTSLVSVARSGVASSGNAGSSAISADGRHVAFVSTAADLVAGDTNAATDVFLRDLAAGSTIRVSVSTRGAQANGPSRQPDVSAHGAHIAFSSEASNLVPHDTNASPDVFIRNLGR